MTVNGCYQWYRVFYRGKRQQRRTALPLIHLYDQPVMDNVDNILLLRFAQRFSLRYLVPLRQAPATAGCRRMLRDKYRMAPHRRLLTIIRRVSWRQSLGDKISGVFINYLRAFIPAILSFFIPRRKRERNVDRARRAKSGSSAFISIPNVLTFVLIVQARRYLPESFPQDPAPDSRRQSPFHAAQWRQYRRPRRI